MGYLQARKLSNADIKIAILMTGNSQAFGEGTGRLASLDA